MNKLKTLWQKRQSYTLYWFVAIWAVIVDACLFMWGLSRVEYESLFYFFVNLLAGFCIWMTARYLAGDYK